MYMYTCVQRDAQMYMYDIQYTAVSGFNSWWRQYIVAQRAGRSKLGTQGSIYVGRISATCFLTMSVDVATGTAHARIYCQCNQVKPLTV